MLKMKVIKENNEEMYKVIESDNKYLEVGDIISEAAIFFCGYWEIEYDVNDTANAYTYEEACESLGLPVDEVEELHKQINNSIYYDKLIEQLQNKEIEDADE